MKARQESIDLLKGSPKNQITSFKEMIAKVLDKDISLGEKIRTLFREQGIMIASILTAIGMVMGVLVELLLPGGGVDGAVASGFIYLFIKNPRNFYKLHTLSKGC